MSQNLHFWWIKPFRIYGMFCFLPIKIMLLLFFSPFLHFHLPPSDGSTPFSLFSQILWTKKVFYSRFYLDLEICFLGRFCYSQDIFPQGLQFFNVDILWLTLKSLWLGGFLTFCGCCFLTISAAAKIRNVAERPPSAVPCVYAEFGRFLRSVISATVIALPSMVFLLITKA